MLETLTALEHARREFTMKTRERLLDNPYALDVAEKAIGKGEAKFDQGAEIVRHRLLLGDSILGAQGSGLGWTSTADLASAWIAAPWRQDGHSQACRPVPAEDPERAGSGRMEPVREPSTRPVGAIRHVWYFEIVIKTTIYMPEDLHRELKHAAKERGTSEAELIRTAVRHELLGAPAGQAERGRQRARLLAAMGTLDSSVYPSAYLDELRAGWRG